jgi:hypothetical protein
LVAAGTPRAQDHQAAPQSPYDLPKAFELIGSTPGLGFPAGATEAANVKVREAASVPNAIRLVRIVVLLVGC